MNMQENIITFDESSKQSLLRMMNKSVDSQGFIVEKENPSERVLTKDGEEIKLEEFAGVRKGSEVFIKNDINSILELAESF
jgi:hypothetical protein